MQSEAQSAESGHITGFGTPFYRNYVLLLLMAVP